MLIRNPSGCVLIGMPNLVNLAHRYAVFSAKLQDKGILHLKGHLFSVAMVFNKTIGNVCVLRYFIALVSLNDQMTEARKTLLLHERRTVD